MTKNNVQIWLKWFWVAIIAAGLLWYLCGRWKDMLEALRYFTLLAIVSSTVFILLAKLALAEVAYVATRVTSQFLGRKSVYRLYNTTQLGKYIPGSIWQYAGRSIGYRLAGASCSQTANAILLETFWVVGGAALIGTILSGPTLLRHAVHVDAISPNQFGTVIAIALVCGVLLVFGVIFWRINLIRIRQVMFPPLKVIILQTAIWCLLGLSFGILVKSVSDDIPSGYIVGLFAIAYTIGFVTVFAPAGLGAREGILMLGLGPYMPVEKALVIVVVARMVYLLSELILAGIFLTRKSD